MSSELDLTLANLEKIQTETAELVEVTKGAIQIPNVNAKVIQRNFAEFCTSLIEKLSGMLDKDEATTILCEQISAVQGVKGKQLAEFLAQRMKSLESDNEASDFSRSLSRCFSGISDDIDITTNDKAAAVEDEGQPSDGSAASRQRFSWAEKI